MNERFGRRAFFPLATGLLLTACGAERPTATPLPTAQVGPMFGPPQPPEPTRNPQELWVNFTPLQKIQALENGTHPDIPYFNKRSEMVSAAAHFYYDTLKAISSDAIPKNELVAMVEFLPHDEFYQARLVEFRRVFGREPMENEDAKIKLTVANTGEKIQIDNDAMNRDADKVRSSTTIMQQLQGRDPLMVMLKTMLFHEFSHKHVTKEELPITPYQLATPDGTFIFNRISGYEFVGVDPEGKNYTLHGPNEAMTEYTAYIVAQRSGLYMSRSSAYGNGAALIRSIHQRAGISDDDHLKYFTGVKSEGDLLKKWGMLKNPQQSDLLSAQAALVAIGLHAQNDMTLEEAKGLVIKFTNH